jgi:hypothetical protein
MDPKEIQEFVKDKKLVWTMTTNGYKYYTLNLVTWLRDIAKVPWMLCVVCCDKESHSFFRRESIPCCKSFGDRDTNQVTLSAFGSESFSRLNEKKLELLSWVTTHAHELGIEKSLYLDGDIVVREDPWPSLDSVLEEVDVCFQCDCSNSEDHSDCGCICTGVIAMRHHETYPEKYQGLYTIDRELWKECQKQDQPYVQRRLADIQATYKTLARRDFGNGTWQKSGKWREQPWILLHYNYRVGDTKKQAMRRAGPWRIPY